MTVVHIKGLFNTLDDERTARVGRLGCLLVVFFMLVALARSVHLLSFGVEFVADRLTVDDTYYYFGTAWNHRFLGFPTFDGINQTNGVQFFWYWVLYGLSHAFGSRESFLLAGLHLSAFLGVLCILLAYWVGGLLESRRGGMVMALPVFCLVISGKHLLMGLENGLHLFVLLLLVGCYLRFLRLAGEGITGRLGRWYLLLMGLLCLNVWCRLDAAVISVLVAGHATVELYQAMRKERLKALKLSGFGAALCLATACVMFGSYFWMGQSFFPVSGLCKNSFRIPLTFDRFVYVFKDLWHKGLTLVFPARVLFSWPGTRWVAQGVVIGLVVLEGCAHRMGPVSEKPMRRGLVVLTLAVLIQLIVVILMTSELPVWYMTPLHVLMALAITSFFVRVPAQVVVEGMGRAVRFQWLYPILFSFVLVLVFMQTRYQYGELIRNRGQPATFHGERYRVARWLAQNTSPNARVASYNSGELGYFSNRRVTNLDGLINGKEYFDFRRAGGSVLDYLRQQGIQYFVDYKVPPEIAGSSRVIYSHPLPAPKPPIEVRRMNF